MPITIGNIGNDNISAAEADWISHFKVRHQLCFVHSQTGNVAAATVYLHGSVKSGTLRGFRARLEETAISTGSDRTVTIALARSTGGGAYTAESSIQFSQADAVRTFKTGTFSNATLSAGEVFRVTVTLAGSTGTAAAGLLVELFLDEGPMTSF